MKKLAVHLHLHYDDQWPEIRRYLNNLASVEHDLFVTMTKPHPAIEAEMKALDENIHIWQVENNGYDIGPFIYFLHHIDLDQYQYILKLHTKGKKSRNYTWLNHHRLDNALWGKILWQSMLATESRLQQNLQILDSNPQFGMAGSKYCLTASVKDYASLLPQINGELKKLGLPLENQLSFIAGTMFLTRTSILKPLLYYRLSDFSKTDAYVKEGTLAHIVERILGCLAQNIYPIEHGNYTFDFIWVTLKRFLYQQKQTKHGTQVVKICKIPVYSKKLKEA